MKEIMIAVIATLFICLLMIRNCLQMAREPQRAAVAVPDRRTRRKPNIYGKIVSLPEGVRGTWEGPEEEPEEPPYTLGNILQSQPYTPEVTVKDKYLIPFRIVSARKYETMKAENQKMIVDLARSGNQYYMQDCARLSQNYKPLQDKLKEAEATINGQQKEIELYILIIEKYKEALKADPDAVHRLMLRDSKTGRFVSSDQEDNEPESWEEDEPEEGPEEADSLPEDGDPEESESEEEPEEYPRLTDPLPKMSKYVKAYRLKQNGANNITIAAELNIKPAGVPVYVSKGRKELEEMRIPIQVTDCSWSSINGFELTEILEKRKAS